MNLARLPNPQRPCEFRRQECPLCLSCRIESGPGGLRAPLAQSPGGRRGAIAVH